MLPLGRVDKPDPDSNGCKHDKRREAHDEFVVARVSEATPGTCGSFTVIARSPCDEAIHRAAYATVDCFAHRTALCAEPVACNDGLKIPSFHWRHFRQSLSLNEDIDMIQTSKSLN
jgi:hypothetical protein